METGSTEMVMSGATPRRPYRVLVVDDDSTNLILATEVIRLHGAIPVACEDAQTALRQFADDHWDIVFMDIRMPGMNGLEAAKAFRGDLVSTAADCVSDIGFTRPPRSS